MKKILAALLGLTFAFTLTACGGTDEPQEIIQEDPTQIAQPDEDPSLTALRQEIARSGSVCAVGYLGQLPPGGDVTELYRLTAENFRISPETAVVCTASAEHARAAEKTGMTVYKIGNGVTLDGLQDFLGFPQ